MKVVHALSWYFPQNVGGTEVYVDGLCKLLCNHGFHVLIAAPLAGAETETRYEHGGTQIFRYPVPSCPTRAESRANVVACGAEKFHQWLSVERPDWVHFHSFSTGLNIFELEAARCAGARLLATNHLASLGFICQRGTLMRWGEQLCDGISEPIKCGECLLQQRGLHKNAARVLARVTSLLPLHSLPTRLGSAVGMPQLVKECLRRQNRMIELVEKFVVLNQWAADAVIANGAPRDKVVLNRLGVSGQAVSRKPGPDQQPTSLPVKVGYFGRISRLKGVSILAFAFARLPRDTPITLEFCGPRVGTDEESLFKEIHQLLRADCRVTFREAVAPSAAIRLLSSYDVICIPSVWFENGPTVMLEALAAGTPVIGTRVGAMPEVITHGVNGLLTTPGSVHELSDALAKVASDPRGTIDVWRADLPEPRTMDEVALDYARLYRS